LDFFWRGAGRAFYFSPLHMLQSVFSPWIAAEMEAPDEQAFKGLKAGITWATNVVNMRQPEIFEDLIKRRGAQEESEGTIRHGVAASTTMAIDITPNHPVVKAYLDYRPKKFGSESTGAVGKAGSRTGIQGGYSLSTNPQEAQDAGPGVSLPGSGRSG